MTAGVEAIIRKMLEPKASKRYQSATQLREDLQRHLDNLPLRFAPNRSIKECAGKWRKRHPKTLLTLAITLFVTFTVGTSGYVYSKSAAQQTLTAIDRARQIEKDLDTIRLDLLLPNETTYRPRGITRAHVLLAEYGLPEDRDWRKRTEYLATPPKQRAKLAADLGELLLLLAQSQLVNAVDKAPNIQKISEALELNELARTCFDKPPPFLFRQREKLAALIGREVENVEPEQAATPRDHFLCGVGEMDSRMLGRAIPHFEKVVAESSDHGAAHMLLAYCRQMRGQYERATERFQTAQSLMPRDPRPAMYAGVMHTHQRNYEDAQAAFTQAIAIDPDRHEPFRNRASIRIHVGKLDDAESDLNESHQRGLTAIQFHSMRAMLRKARKDDIGFREDSNLVATLEPVHENDFLMRGQVREGYDRAGALADYQKAEELAPKLFHTYLRQARLHAQILKDYESALKVWSRAEKSLPDYGIALSYKAVLLARMGKREESHQLTQLACAMNQSTTASYNAACVYSLTSRNCPADKREAMKCLKVAIRAFDLREQFQKDPDFEPLKGVPEFEALIKVFSRSQD